MAYLITVINHAFAVLGHDRAVLAHFAQNSEPWPASRAAKRCGNGQHDSALLYVSIAYGTLASSSSSENQRARHDRAPPAGATLLPAAVRGVARASASDSFLAARGGAEGSVHGRRYFVQFFNTAEGRRLRLRRSEVRRHEPGIPSNISGRERNGRHCRLCSVPPQREGENSRHREKLGAAVQDMVAGFGGRPGDTVSIRVRVPPPGSGTDGDVERDALGSGAEDRAESAKPDAAGAMDSTRRDRSGAATLIEATAGRVQARTKYACDDCGGLFLCRTLRHVVDEDGRVVKAKETCWEIFHSRPVSEKVVYAKKPGAGDEAVDDDDGRPDRAEHDVEMG
jgi:hypothetical protein